MKMEKKYATLIAVIVIFVFLIGFFIGSYFPNLSFKTPLTTGNVGTSQPNPNVPISQQKTLSFASASCSASGNNDIISFKIQSTGIDIGQGEITAYLDNTLPQAPGFIDSSGNRIDNIALPAGSTSAEFSYTTSDHKTSRKITISSPAGQTDQMVTCS